MSNEYFVTLARENTLVDQVKEALAFWSRYVVVGKSKTFEEAYDNKLQCLEDKIKQEKSRALAHMGLVTYEAFNNCLRLQDELSTLRATRQATAEERKREHHRLLEERVETCSRVLAALSSARPTTQSSPTPNFRGDHRADAEPRQSCDTRDAAPPAHSRRPFPATRNVSHDDRATGPSGPETSSLVSLSTSALRDSPDRQPSTTRAGKRPFNGAHGNETRQSPTTDPPRSEDRSLCVTKRQCVSSPDESDDESDADPQVRGATPPPPDRRAAQRYDDTSPRQSSPAQHANATQGTETPSSPRDNAARRQRVSPRQHSLRTTTFDKVFSDGKAPWRHSIVRHPSTGKFYIFKCDDHGVHFKAHDFGGAMRHLRSQLHGYKMPEPSHDTVVEVMGTEVEDCTVELMKLNNDLLDEDIKEDRYTVLNRQLMTSDEVREMEEAASNRKMALQRLRLSRMREQGPEPPSPGPSRGLSQEIGYDMPYVIDAKAGDPYFAYNTTRKSWFVALALPHGPAFGDKTLEHLRLPHHLLHRRGLMEDPPSCYTFSKFSRTRKLHGWASGFETNGKMVRERKFPVLSFDRTDFINEGTAAWVAAGDLRVFKPWAAVASQVPQLRGVRIYFRDVGRWDVIGVMEAGGWRCQRWEEESVPEESDAFEAKAEGGSEGGNAAGEEHSGVRDGEISAPIQVDSDGDLLDHDLGPQEGGVPREERDPEGALESMEKVDDWHSTHGGVQGQEDGDGVDATTGQQPYTAVEGPRLLGRIDTTRQGTPQQGREAAQPTMPLPSATTFHSQRATGHTGPTTLADQTTRAAQQPPPEEHNSTHLAPMLRPTDGAEESEQPYPHAVLAARSAQPHHHVVPPGGRSPLEDPIPQNILDIMDAAARDITPDGGVYVPPARHHVFAGQTSALASLAPSQALLNMASKAQKATTTANGSSAQLGSPSSSGPAPPRAMSENTGRDLAGARTPGHATARLDPFSTTRRAGNNGAGSWR